jgi:hypothetical protein
MPNKEQTNTMAAWLWKAPIKFTGLFVGGMIVLITALIPIPRPLPGWVAGILMPVVLAFIGFSIYKLIRFAPAASLDRKSFIGIDVGITIVRTLFYLIPLAIMLAAVGFADFQEFFRVLGYMLALFVMSYPVFSLVMALVLSIVFTYIVGLMIANYIITFRRGQMMGVRKWKLWLSVPFGLHLLWLPGYFLAEERKPKPAVRFKSKWYADFIDWIMKRPLNAMIVFALTAACAGIPLLFGNRACASLLPNGILIVLFVVLLAVFGVSKLRRAVPGWFSWITVGVNICAIIAIACYGRSVFHETVAERVQTQITENAVPIEGTDLIPRAEDPITE